MRKLYELIKALSILIRQFMLPNPFESMQNGVLYNLIATVVLVPITFGMVGFLYERGSAPALGSILFLFFYLINTGVLMLCSFFNFSTTACVIIGIVYALLFTGVIALKNKIGGGYYL